MTIQGRALIEARGLSKTYEIDSQVLRAVDSVSFSVVRGEMMAIVGHSGSGKTTLLSLIGGLTRPDSGTVLIDGSDLWGMSDNGLSAFRNRKLGFIYQFSSLIPTLTSLENVVLPTAFGEFDGDVEDRARELLGLVGMTDKTNVYPAHLSGGQQRRVAIARAFINSPDIVLADEPTGDLDEDTEKEVIDLFLRMNKELGITFVIVTHAGEIAASAGRRLKMTNGVLAELP